MKKITFILFGISVLLLASCGKLLQKDVIIDNPTENEITVSIDGAEHKVAAFQSVEVKLSSGEHAIGFQQEGKATEQKVNIEKDGILNTTGETYVLWKDIYLENQDEFDKYVKKLDEKPVTINDYEYVGDLTVYGAEDYFVPKTWNYGLDTEWPSTIQIENSYEIKAKIYRLEDFENDY